MSFDYLVLGAGVSGMTTAVLLAQAGFKVALVEKAPKLAPLLRGFSRQGVFFDTGFHYTGGLGDGEILDLSFRHLGLAGDLSKYPFDPAAFDCFLGPEEGSGFCFPVGYERLGEALCAAFPAEIPAITAYLRRVGEVCDSFPYLNLDAAWESFSAFGQVQSETLREVLDQLTPSAPLKRLLSLHFLLYGVSPDEVSFSQHASVVGTYYQSVHGLQGGGLSLAKAFEKRLGALGVELFLGRGAEKILLSPSGTLAGIRLEGGGVLSCSGCVSTVHPHIFLELAGDTPLRPAYRKRLAQLEETASAFVLYAVTEKPVSCLSKRNLFLGGKDVWPPVLTEGNLDDRSLYVTAASPAFADSGRGGLIAICPANFREVEEWADSESGKRPESYRRYKEEVVDRLWRRIEKELPELRGQCLSREGATPLTMRHFTQAPRGGLYGVKHKAGQFNPQPPTRIPGVWLAGQGVVAPGILGAVLSGYLACGNILGHERLRKELKQCR
jgi:all-trans-retinol 13,14-reductase